MNKQKRPTARQWIPGILVILLAISLAGCKPVPTPSPTTTPEEPTPTRIPTATPTLKPTPTPTSTPPPTQTPLPPPEAPVTDPEGPEITVPAGKKLAVRASATGADGYKWGLQGDGEISATEGDTILYTAPEQAVEGATVALLTVTAYNDHGESPQTSLVINVSVSEIVSIGLDALAIPAGWMSGRPNPANFIDLQASPDDCHTGADCIRFTYETGGEWAGVYWWPPACGESGTEEAWKRVRNGTCGVNVLEAGNLGAVNRLTFWVRGDQGGEIVEFKVGGVDVLPTPGRSLGKVTLKPTWEQYEIDLENLDLTNAIGLFLWVAADDTNPKGAVFHLDDVQFEGVVD